MKYLILLALIGCGSEEPTQPTIQTNPTFGPYISTILSDHRYYGGNPPPTFTVIFGNTNLNGNRKAATCTYNNKVITVNESLWTYYSETRKYLIIAHEYGHCYLNRPDITTYSNYRAVSIMNENMISELTYLRNPDYYKQELYK